MGRFIVTLTDDHRAKLETYRKAHGLRSEAEAVRHMIERSCEVFAEVFERAMPAFKAEREAIDATRYMLEADPMPAPTLKGVVLNEAAPPWTVEREYIDAPAVTFGPAKAAPGSRLKKPKGEK